RGLRRGDLLLPRHGRLQPRPGRLPRAPPRGEGPPRHPGDRQPQRAHPRRLGALRETDGAGGGRRPGAERLRAAHRPAADADRRRTGPEVEGDLVGLVADVCREVSLPVAVKLSPFYSAPANLGRRLAAAGAKALVLFNRFYQPDFDLETLEVVPSLWLSTADELRLRLHWVAILYGHVGCDLAVTGGVHTAHDVLKVLMAGGAVAMMTSGLLGPGVGHRGG